jgi:cytochrome c-type biogenesis protein CcmE
MTRKRRRLIFVLLGLAALGSATGLVLSALSDTLVYFYTPGDLKTHHVAPGQAFRIGGLVVKGTLTKNGDQVRFIVTDFNGSVPVLYTGLLPDLFREGQGVVAEGSLDGDGAFHATEVLAKHDATYMPKDVADALKKSGHWKDQYQTGEAQEKMAGSQSPSPPVSQP